MLRVIPHILTYQISPAGTFKDGHDDAEVIQYRQHAYLPQMLAWRKQSLQPEDFLDGVTGEFTLDLKDALAAAWARVQLAE